MRVLQPTVIVDAQALYQIAVCDLELERLRTRLRPNDRRAGFACRPCVPVDRNQPHRRCDAGREGR